MGEGGSGRRRDEENGSRADLGLRDCKTARPQDTLPEESDYWLKAERIFVFHRW